jgi:ceramide glucosyltransferase
VTHAITGGEERTAGAILDGLYLSCQAAPGVIAAQRVGGRDIVVGKSMALRASDLARLGGFTAVKDVLAEDYVLGTMVGEILGKAVRIGRLAVTQITERRTLAAFLSRSLRWAIIHKHAVPPAAYAGVILLHPLIFLGGALALEPTPLVGGLAAARVALDAFAAKLTRGSVPGPRALALLPLRDLVHGLVWLRALASNTVDWRGKKLRVGAGTRLADAPAGMSADAAQVYSPACAPPSSPS